MAEQVKEEKEEPSSKKRSSVKLVKRVRSKKAEQAAAPEQPQVAKSEPAPERLSSKKRAQRASSNVFAMFTQNQVHQFKEAFGFIDQDKDGVISRQDIRATFDALGRLCSEQELDQMTGEASGPINFTMFLSVFGARVQGADDEEVVLDAFSRFDQGDGFCEQEQLRHSLMTWGEKFTPEECDVLLQEAPLDSRGRLNVRRFAQLVTRGQDDDDDDEQLAE